MAFQPEAKADPNNPWIPNKIKDKELTTGYFFLSHVFSIRFCPITWTLPPTQPITNEYTGCTTYKEAVPAIIPPAIGPKITSLITSLPLKTEDQIKLAIVAEHNE